MSKEGLHPEEFDYNATIEQARQAIDHLRQRSFYASVLIDTFLEGTEEDSWVTAVDDRYKFFAVGARIKSQPDGLFVLKWGTYADKYQVKLDIDRFPSMPKERLRDELIYGEYLSNRLSITSDGRAPGMFTGFRGDGKWDQDTKSNLTISFYPSRWEVAPANPEDNFNWWVLNQFVPRFLQERVAPVARVPREELSGSIVIDDPEGD